MNALLQLSADLDRVIHFRRIDDEDESHMGRNIGIGIGAAGIGAGGYYGHKAIMRNYGGNNPVGPTPNLNPVGPAPNLNPSGPMPNLNPTGPTQNLNPVGPSPGLTGPKNAYRSFYEDMKSRSGKYASGVGSAVSEVPGSYNSLRAGAAQGLGYGRGTAIKNALVRAGKKIGGLKFQSRSPMVQLSAELSDAILFKEEDPQYASRALFGLPTTAFIKARPGQGLQAAAHSVGHGFYEAGKFGIGGAGLGAGIGAAVGALSKGRYRAGDAAKAGAMIGGVGGYLGGATKAQFDKRGTEIMRKYQ